MNKEDRAKHKRLKEIIVRVNKTLSYYDPGYISAKRFSNYEDNYMNGVEVCKSFTDYIEMRLNYECSKIPELEEIEQITEGNLLKLVSIEGEDLDRKRFKYATFTILTPDMIVDPDEDLIREIEKAKTFLIGENKKGLITFNDVKNRISIKIV